MDHFPLWYRQAAEQPAGSFVFNLRSAEGPGNAYPCVPGAKLDQGVTLPAALGGKQEQMGNRMSTPLGSLPTFPPDTR